MAKRIDNSYDIVFGALLFSLPFSIAVPNILLIILALFTIFDIKNVARKFDWRVFSILYLFILYVIVKAAVNQSLIAEFNFYKKYLIIFILPVLCTKVNNFKIVKVLAVCGVYASIIFTIYMAINYYIKYSIIPFSNGETANTLLTSERPYIGVMAVVTSLLSFSLAKDYRRYRFHFIIGGIVSIIFVVLISARLSFISFVIIALIYLLFYYKASALKKSVYIFSIMAAILFVIVFSKNMRERFFINNTLEQSLEIASQYEPRINIWQCGFEMFLDKEYSYFTGYPNNTVINNNYSTCYSQTIQNQSKKNWFVTNEFNSHNQLLDIALSQGFIGLNMLLCFLIMSVNYVRKKFYNIATLLTIIMFLLLENVFHRQLGCYLFGTFFCLQLINARANEKN